MPMIFSPTLATASLDQLRPIGVLVLMANLLDCEAISGLLASHEGIYVVNATDDMELGFASCRQLNPAVLIFDPKVGRDAVSCATKLVAANAIRHAIILDDQVHDALVSSILDFPRISYLTRAATGSLLIEMVEKLGSGGKRLFGPAVADRIIPSPRGLCLRTPTSTPSVVALTKREQDVLKLLATGYSVRDCAEELNVAVSTVDNHKTSLMKKLCVHKSAQLVHLAIRDGLVAVCPEEQGDCKIERNLKPPA
ncbi:MAG: response regulator transcription factor [Planctomycetes bacterium]|nr:response regulator transcription factor [Planctomycetota bacterium]